MTLRYRSSDTLNLSSEPLNGNWKLHVDDTAHQDTGCINSWSVAL